MNEVKNVIKIWAKWSLGEVDALEWVRCTEDAEKHVLENVLSFLAGYFSSEKHKLRHLVNGNV